MREGPADIGAMGPSSPQSGRVEALALQRWRAFPSGIAANGGLTGTGRPFTRQGRGTVPDAPQGRCAAAKRHFTSRVQPGVLRRTDLSQNIEQSPGVDALITDPAALAQLRTILARRIDAETRHKDADTHVALIDRRIMELDADIATAESAIIPLYDPRPAGRLALLLKGGAAEPDPAEVQRRREHNAQQRDRIDEMRRDLALLQEERTRAKAEAHAAAESVSQVGDDFHVAVADAVFLAFQRDALALVERRLIPLKTLAQRRPARRKMLLDRLAHVEIGWRDSRPSPFPVAPDRSFTRSVWPIAVDDAPARMAEILERISAELTKEAPR